MNTDSRINIIYVICHALGKETGAYGRLIDTPNIDCFSSEGAVFDNAFRSSTACSPSHCCAYTGIYAHVNGVIGLVHIGFPLSNDIRTVVDYMNDSGYETVHFRMQHERMGVSNRYKFELNQCDEREKAFGEKAVDTAIDYLSLRKRTGAPFYLNIGINEVHASNWQYQVENLKKYTEALLRKTFRCLFISQTHLSSGTKL